MRTRYDQLIKSLLRDTLTVGGRMHRQHEVRSHLRAVDGWFVPDPARTAALAHRGLLGRMAAGPPGLFEAFHEPPSIDEVRNCICKQLIIDAERIQKAARVKPSMPSIARRASGSPSAALRSKPRPRPQFPPLWIISAGHPARVLDEYDFRIMPGWPPGFWQRSKADAFGLVVVSNLPCTRDTLMLRLMGAGAVRAAAIEELHRLPDDAWERDVAEHNLVALRFDLPQDAVGEDKEYLVSTEILYEHWRKHHVAEGVKQGLRKGLRKGREQTLRRSLRTVYESRFGPMPPALIAALNATADPVRLESWLPKVAVASTQEIAALLTPGGRDG